MTDTLKIAESANGAVLFIILDLLGGLCLAARDSKLSIYYFGYDLQVLSVLIEI